MSIKKVSNMSLYVVIFSDLDLRGPGPFNETIQRVISRQYSPGLMGTLSHAMRETACDTNEGIKIPFILL